MERERSLKGSLPLRLRAVDTDELSLARLSEMSAAEDKSLSDARGRAGPSAGIPSPPVGAFLTWLAATTRASSVVEVGGSAGIGGLCLLRGMVERASLTTIEPDAEARDTAAEAYKSAEVGRRVRTIVGVAAEVLERLSDGGYDLVIMHAVDGEPDQLAAHVRRILRPGGVVVVRQVAAGRQHRLAASEAFTRALVDDEELKVVVLPVDGGLTLATLRANAG